jgi:hypothetical protein
MTAEDTLDESGGAAEVTDTAEAPDGVLAAVAAQEADAAPAALWSALSEALAGDTTDQASSGATGSTQSGVARGLTATTEMIERFVDDGLLRVVVVDLEGMGRPDRPPASAQPLRDAVEAMSAALPAAEIRYLGRPADSMGGSPDTVAELIAGSGTASPELVSGALERAFGQDPGVLVRFVGTLREALPPDTAIILRGSAVSGHSYTTEQPFDGAGAGTSDLDIVLIGAEVLELFDAEARLFGGVNTLPLSDHAPWVAPDLDPARRRCQEMVGRPVNIQVMSRWFLDLRAAVQGQPYVDLFLPPD